jgi:hypothetical protein
MLQCARFHDLAEFDMDRRSCRVRLAEHNRRRRAMTTDRKPKDSYDSQDESAAPQRIVTTDVSSYHTPSNSTPSYISTGDISTERAQSVPSLPADLAAAVANLPMDFNIDALIGPLASCFHSLHQIAPPPPQMPQQPLQRHPAPLVDMMMSTKPLGPTLHFGGDIAPPHNNYFDSFDGMVPVQPSDCGLTDDALTAVLDTSDIFSDNDLDLALAGILDPVIDPSLPPPPVYTSPDLVVRMSMKFFSCMPTDLPPTLREELERSLQISSSMLEGYVRPGCTHLTVDLRLPADVAARIEATPLDVILQELSKKFPNEDGLLAQIGKQVAAIKAGKTLAAVVDPSGPRGPHLTALSRVCVSVDEAACTRVDLYGSNIGRAGDLVLCRQHGEHVTVEMLDTAAWNMRVDEDEEEEFNAAIERENGDEDQGNVDGDEFEIDADNLEEDDNASATGVLDVDYAASSIRSGTSSTSGWDPTQPNGQTVKAGCMPATSVRLLGLRCGVAEVEVQTGGVLSESRPLLVLSDAAAAAEVEQLAYRARRAVWLDSFLRDVGAVVAHICSEGAAARLPGDVVEALAARTSAYCMEAGCPALGRLLRRAQNALRRAIGTDDTASRMAEMLEGAAKEKVERHLAAKADAEDVVADSTATIPLVVNLKKLSVATTDSDSDDSAAAAANKNTNCQGWKVLAPIAASVAAVAVAFQRLFQG